MSKFEDRIQFGDNASFAICVGRGVDPAWRTMNLWFSGFQYGFNDESNLSVSLDWMEGVLLDLIGNSGRNGRDDLDGISCNAAWKRLYVDSCSMDSTRDYRFLAGVEFDAFRGVSWSANGDFRVLWKLARRAWPLMPDYPKRCVSGSCPLPQVSGVVSEFPAWFQTQKPDQGE